MSERRPIIGIPCSMNDEKSRMHANFSYFDSVYRAGGIPVFLPFTEGETAAETFLSDGIFDGILFSGGCDINPARYGEEITGENVTVSESRDSFELGLVERLKDSDLPIFGICRGIQTINVGFGGTLHQDIKGHRQEESGDNTPFCDRVVPGTRLHEILGSDTTMVNSFHHQAVKDVAPGFVASAVSEDGIIEAIELRDRSRYVVGVQWHPERFYGINDHSDKLFAAFIEEAKKHIK